MESKQTMRLRFAALRRVSTEKQEKEGDSLRTQTSDIERAIQQLGGSVCEWYGGQEHATPGHEKKEIDRLLGDASRRVFDAVIVAHADRWSRDNSKSHQGLEAFRHHGIRFFVAVTEYDLFNEEHCLFLEMSAVFGQFSARQQNRKSIASRISRAKRGLPTCGKLPFGRRRDPLTGHLIVDAEKQKKIEHAAKRYLSGEPLPRVARDLGMNHSNLHKILTKRCGSEWEIRFDSESANVHEVVKLQIPPLLDEETIRAIKNRVEANRTYAHGQRRDGAPYLLSRVIFCAHCGYAMFGQTNHDCRRYYRHAHAERDRKCTGPETKSWIRADVIEDLVMRHLFETFGNPVAMQRAMEAATPDLEKVAETRRSIEAVSMAMLKTQQGRQRVLQLVAEDTLSLDAARPQLKRLDELERDRQDELTRLQNSIAHIPTREAIKAVANKLASKVQTRERTMRNAALVARIRHANHAFEEMTSDERRALVQMVFGGKRADGNRMGVYIEWSDSEKRGGWRYSIHGHLIDEKGWLPFDATVGDQFTFGAAPGQKELVVNCASC